MERIAAERRLNGMSQTGLARKLGVSRQTVYRWENGRSQPPASAVLVMAGLFGVSTDYLIGETDERK